LYKSYKESSDVTERSAENLENQTPVTMYN